MRNVESRSLGESRDEITPSIGRARFVDGPDTLGDLLVAMFRGDISAMLRLTRHRAGLRKPIRKPRQPLLITAKVASCGGRGFAHRVTGSPSRRFGERALTVGKGLWELAGGEIAPANSLDEGRILP
jgi:hypothetical protein